MELIEENKPERMIKTKMIGMSTGERLATLWAKREVYTELGKYRRILDLESVRSSNKEWKNGFIRIRGKKATSGFKLITKGLTKPERILIDDTYKPILRKIEKVRKDLAEIDGEPPQPFSWDIVHKD